MGSVAGVLVLGLVLLAASTVEVGAWPKEERSVSVGGKVVCQDCTKGWNEWIKGSHPLKDENNRKPEVDINYWKVPCLFKHVFDFNWLRAVRMIGGATSHSGGCHICLNQCCTVEEHADFMKSVKTEALYDYGDDGSIYSASQ